MQKSTPPVLPYHSSHPFTQRYTHKSHAYIGWFSPPSMHIGYCRSCPQPTQTKKCRLAVIPANAVTNNNFLAKKKLFTIWYILAVVRYRDGGKSARTVMDRLLGSQASCMFPSSWRNTSFYSVLGRRNGYTKMLNVWCSVIFGHEWCGMEL